MTSGAFLGGVVKGLESAEKARDADRQTTLAEQRLATETKLQERQIANEEQRTRLTSAGNANKAVNDALQFITETAKQAREAGATPAQIEALITPVAQSAAQTYAAAGGSPEAILKRIAATIATPSAPQTDLGKLEADRRSGFIDDATYQAKAKALTTPAGGTTINMAGEKEFNKELGKSVADDFVERRKTAIGAIQSLRANDEALRLLNAGIISGTGADLLLNTGKALQQVGINLAPDAIANTEAFFAQRAQAVGQLIKSFNAGGVSDADREFATKAAAGQIALTEQSIRKILELNAKVSRDSIKIYNEEAGKIDPGAIPFDLRLPELPESTDGQPPIRKTLRGKTFEKRDGNWFSVDGETP